ncbi:MAG: 50S ribosomal protein L32 [Chloroflexi bacterium]|nr:50S ribosomal protein L32 [Chloroflexota bacterium]MBC7257190.1 50S ribosomal protein L32 [Chloroflexota bacterium]
MTPLPKRKHSHGRTHRRRSHDALKARRLIECPTCHSPRLAHRVCPVCGHYRGQAVLPDTR